MSGKKLTEEELKQASGAGVDPNVADVEKTEGDELDAADLEGVSGARQAPAVPPAGLDGDENQDAVDPTAEPTDTTGLG